MKRLLVCLDSSNRASQVLAAAVELVQAFGGSLLLLRAIGLDHPLSQNEPLSPDELRDRLIDQERGDLIQRAAVIPEKALEEIVVMIGTPWSAICETAREKQVDLIVIGSHGYSGLDRLLGTTAAKVIHHADRSVFVFRPTEDDSSTAR